MAKFAAASGPILPQAPFAALFSLVHSGICKLQNRGDFFGVERCYGVADGEADLNFGLGELDRGIEQR